MSKFNYVINLIILLNKVINFENTKINQKFFRFVSMPHAAVYMRSMGFQIWMVIAKSSHTGNCRCLNSNGISVVMIGMRDNRTSLNFSFKLYLRRLLITFLTDSLALLQSRGEFMFWKRMMGTPVFNFKICIGMTGKSSEFRNSLC